MEQLSKEQKEAFANEDNKRNKYLEEETKKHLDFIKNYRPVSKKSLKKFEVEMKNFFHPLKN